MPVLCYWIASEDFLRFRFPVRTPFFGIFDEKKTVGVQNFLQAWLVFIKMYPCFGYGGVIAFPETERNLVATSFKFSQQKFSRDSYGSA